MARGYLSPWHGGSSLAPIGLESAFGGSLFDLHRRMNRLFDTLFEQGDGGGGALSASTLAAPALDIAQDDRQIEITAELPGVKEEDIDLSIEDGMLTLTGEKKKERKDEESGYSERTYGRFERRLTLPPNIDEERCSADFRDGVLRITIPKVEGKQRGRRIPLGRGAEPAQRIEAQNDREPSMQQAAAEEERREGEHQPS
jgi:HSP20 family protein